jgi:hypothetical protein
MKHVYEQYSTDDFLLYLNDATKKDLIRDFKKQIKKWINYQRLNTEYESFIFENLNFKYKFIIKQDYIHLDSISYSTTEFKPNEILTIYARLSINKKNGYLHYLTKCTFKDSPQNYSFMKIHKLKYKVFTIYNNTTQNPISTIWSIIDILDMLHNIYKEPTFEKVINAYENKLKY